MKNNQSNELRKFYDIYIIILVILTIAYCIFVFSNSGQTSFDRAKSFMSFITAGYILLGIISFQFIYSLVSKTSGKDAGVEKMSYVILTSAIIPGISPLLFYLFVFRKLL